MGVQFHDEIQDVTCDAWKRLIEAIDQASLDEREKFDPLEGIPREERPQIVTLPPTIGKLRSVKHLYLYGSFLVRIPREIGEMTSLQWFNPYTSSRLHWLPYEITRCKNLRLSLISIRHLYGNFKLRPPPPKLPVSDRLMFAITDGNLRSDREAPVPCSVCDGPCPGAPLQAWISLRVGTDVMPLLVHACSQHCLEALPKPPEQYVQFPHTGGLSLEQPAAGWC